MSVNDTSVAAQQVVDRRYAEMSFAERAERLRAVTLAANEMALAGLLFTPTLPPQPRLFEQDVILRKLEWYRRGGEASERQWRDVLAVLRVQQHLDETYLRRWAERLGVSDLLTRALTDVT